MARVLFGIVALTAGGLLAVGSAQQPKIPLPPIPAQGPNAVDPKMPQFLECSKACDDCARMCELCSAHCGKLLAEGKKEHHHTLRTCQDCASICQSASSVT